MTQVIRKYLFMRQIWDFIVLPMLYFRILAEVPVFVMALILRYFTEFASFRDALRKRRYDINETMDYINVRPKA